MIFGVDVSAYQPNFDFAACRREGYDFAIIKCTEGTGWKSAYFRDQLRRAREAGLLVAAYHYVRGSDVNGQLANVRSMTGTDIPVILDVEDGAGSIQSIRDLNAALNRAGYRTPLIYIPRWYWSGHMGSPSLAGLPPNWHSAYISTIARKDAKVFTDFLARPSTWAGFGGIPIAVAQFTSSLAVANYPNGSIDGNAFRGTREEFAALLNGTSEDDMSWSEELTGPDNFKAPASAWLTYGNKAAQDASAKLDRLASQIVGLSAAVSALAQKVGEQDGADAAELEAAVAKAIRENTLRVDIDVTGPHTDSDAGPTT